MPLSPRPMTGILKALPKLDHTACSGKHGHKLHTGVHTQIHPSTQTQKWISCEYNSLLFDSS